MRRALCTILLPEVFHEKGYSKTAMTGITFWKDSEISLKKLKHPVLPGHLFRTIFIREFVKKGIEKGRRPELVGGGLIRSMGGYAAVKTMRKAGDYMKGDERILDGADFVKTILAQAEESVDRKYRLQAEDYDFSTVVDRVADMPGLNPDEVLLPGKYKKVVEARSVVCYWSVRELGISQEVPA